MIGIIIQDRYEILEKVGVGGMGAVYKAKDLPTGEIFALKMIYKPQDVELKRFNREFFVMSNIYHPNIVQVVNHGQHSDYHFIIMEFIEGDSLKKYFTMQKEALMQSHENYYESYLESVLHIFMQISSSLSYIHSLDIIHRDLKPTNIIITPNNISKLMDFGLSKRVGISSGEFTLGGAITGTVSYMSPEQSSGTKIDIRSDFYSFGVILFEVLTDQKPFTSDNPIEILMKHINEKPPAPSSIEPKIPEDLDRIIFKLLEKDPIDRYQSADDILEDLLKIGILKPTIFLESEAAKEKIQTRLFEPAFIGRADELKKFKELTSEDNRFKSFVLFIEGMPGIGKLRLMSEYENIAKRLGYLCLSGRYFPEHKGSFQAFEDIFENIIYFMEKGNIKIGENKIEEIYSFFSRFIPNMKLMGDDFITGVIGSMFHNLPQDMDINIQFKKLFDILCFISQNNPVIFFLSNYEYANTFNKKLLHYLITNTVKKYDTIPISFVISYNDRLLKLTNLFDQDELDTSQDYFARQNLKGLSLEDTQGFVSQMIGVSKVPDIFVSRIYEDTAGCPLHISESMKFLTEQSILYKRRNKWLINVESRDLPLEDLASKKALNIPINVDEIYKKRIVQLEPVAKDILTLMSFFVDRIELDVLLIISSYTRDETLSGIDMLLKRNLLIEDREGKHFYLNPLKLKNIILSSVPPDERSGLYLKIAQTYEDMYKDNLSPIYTQLAYLYEKAGEYNKAFYFFIKAGENAKDLYFYEQAIDLISKAIDIAKSQEGEDFFDIGLIRSYVANGEIEETRGNTKNAKTYYEKAYGIAKKKNRILDKAKILQHLGWLYYQTGKNDIAKKFFVKSRELFTLKDDKVGIASSMNRIALTELKNGRLKDALRIFLEALIYEKEVNNKIWIAKNLNNIGHIYTRLGNYKLSIKYLAEAMRILENINNKIDLFRCLSNLALSYFYLGKINDSLQANERSLLVARQIDYKQGIGQGLNNTSVILRHMGIYDRSLDNIDSSIELRQNIKDKRGTAIGFLNKGLLLFDIGNMEEAEQYIRKAMEFDDDFGLKDTFIDGYYYLAKISHHQEKMIDASDYLQKSLELARRDKDYYRFIESAVFLSYIEENEKSNEDLIINLLNLKKKALKFGFNLLIARINSRIAELMLKNNNYDDALHYIEAAIPIFEEIQCRPFLVEIFTLAGEFLTKTGQNEKASNFFQKALQYAEEIQSGVPLQYVSNFIVKKEITYLYKILSELY